MVQDPSAVQGEGLVLALHVGRHTLGDDRRVGDGQLELVGDQRLGDGLLEELDLPRRVIGDAEVADLAGGGELVEGAGDLVGFHQRIGPMQQQNVDVVRAQSTQ
jgi:hypothetical protein